jgi:murein DD-endopeptidase MepM/ murein hydrolase activator NlpD
LAGGGGSGGGMMPTSLGRVSTEAFGRFDTTNPLSGMMTKGALSGLFGKAMSAGGGALAATGVLTSLMPSMDKYAVRESGYYMAASYSMGSSGRNDLKNRTLGRLSELGGLTSVGADATVSAILSGRGVNTSNPYYNTLISQIGNVGRFMNMDNEVAAQSMASLTGGRTSASLLQRGIFTSNPLTGKSMKESDIFEQIANRFIVGNMSVDETQDEIRRGFLGANIESLDIDAAAKERLKMYLIARAGGEKIDFTDAASMERAFGEGSALKKGGFTNPLEQIYKINAAETGGLEAFTPSYTEGLTEAAQALQGLYQNVAKTTAQFGSLNAFLSTLLGNDLGANLGNPVSAAALIGVNAAGKSGEQFKTGDFLGALGTIALSMFDPFNFMGVTTGGATGGPGLGDVSLGDNLGLPVPNGFSVTAGYGKEGSEFWDGTHNGIDWGVPVGTKVYAAADGKVEEARESGLTKGYGKYIRLRHGNGFDTIYAHLSEFLVKEGDNVKKGQEIALSGSTGTPEPHLHFEVQNSDGGKDQRPSAFGPSGATGGGSLLSGSGSVGMGSPVGGGGSSGVSTAALLLSGSSQSGAGGTTVISGGGGGGVTINLTVASASEAEAVRFAEIVKQKLEEDSFMSQMGAK